MHVVINGCSTLIARIMSQNSFFNYTHATRHKPIEIPKIGIIFKEKSIGIFEINVDFYFILEPHKHPYMKYEKLKFLAIKPCKLTKNTSMKR